MSEKRTTLDVIERVDPDGRGYEVEIRPAHDRRAFPYVARHDPGSWRMGAAERRDLRRATLRNALTGAMVFFDDNER